MQRAIWLMMALGSAAVLGGAHLVAPDAVPHLTILLLACLSGYLTNFVACAGTAGGLLDELPTLLDKIKAKNAAKKELTQMLDELRKQGKVDWLKQKLWEKISGNTQLSVEELERQLRDTERELLAESELLPSGEQYKQHLENIKEQALNLKGHLGPFKTGNGFALASAVPGFPKTATTLIGLEDFATRLDQAIEETFPVIDRTIEQLDFIAESIKPVLASLRASREALPIAASPKSTVRAMQRALDTMATSCGEVDRLLHKLLLGRFGEGRDKIRELAELVGPHAPVTMRVLRSPSHPGRAFRVRARLQLDAGIFNGINRGDSLIVGLPCGYRLTKPIGVTASRSLRVTVTGNRAGSSVVGIDVQRSSGTDADAITLRINQEIEVTDHACGTGELRVWNLNRNNGVIVPVVTVDA